MLGARSQMQAICRVPGTCGSAAAALGGSAGQQLCAPIVSNLGNKSRRGACSARAKNSQLVVKILAVAGS